MDKKQVVKQVVGIDIGKDSFYVCYKVKYADESVVIKGTKSFNNNLLGMEKFNLWCKSRNKNKDCAVLYLMEATGVYYEELAYFLYNKQQKVSIQLAQKLSYYAKSNNLKTKTDKVDAKMIASFGIEKQKSGLLLWTPPSKDFKQIRDLCREHTNLKEELSCLKSQLHAMSYAHNTYQPVLNIKQEMIAFCELKVKEIERELKRLVKNNKQLAKKIKIIETVKGLGFITIIKVVAEVNGFLLFKNIAQLVSYAGLDVVAYESGSYKGRTKISKKGNVRLRTALYMSSITASTHNKDLKKFYNRINEGKTVKTHGLVAVMRKLLILIYTLWKSEQEYVENYQQIKNKNSVEKELVAVF